MTNEQTVVLIRGYIARQRIALKLIEAQMPPEVETATLMCLGKAVRSFKVLVPIVNVLNDMQEDIEELKANS